MEHCVQRADRAPGRCRAVPGQGGAHDLARPLGPGTVSKRDQPEWARIKVPEPWPLHSNVRGVAGSQFVSQTWETLPEAPANRPVPPVTVRVSSPCRVVRLNETEKETNSSSPFAATIV